jgi:uncharacterized membrane protein YraQ (UPF0718 family)
MIIALIIAGYLIIGSLEVLLLKNKNRERRPIKYYVLFMAISAAISLVIATNEDIPSIASIIAKVFSPVMMK